MADYDVITIGGGVGGSVLARAMAERGYRVLVVEREARFRDRVRGELLFPWGVAEAKALGIYDCLMLAGGHHPEFWSEYAGPDPLARRDFAQDTPQKLRALCMYHPRMQEAVLQAAEAAGAQVRRGVRVCALEPGAEPQAVLEQGGRRTMARARLLIGADGRGSSARAWGGFSAREDPASNLFTGVLLEDAPASAQSSICMMNPLASRMVLYLPQSGSSGRAYLASRVENGRRLRGAADFEAFLAECRRSGLAEELLDGARQAGPLATFQGGESWVEHPYKSAIALIGDAAATTDPTWGQGLSMTLRDARVLRDALVAHDDWDAAGHAYAAEHARYYERVRTANSWFTRIFLEPGAQAERRRAHVLAQLESNPAFLPDTHVAGPDLAPPTQEQRERIFAHG